MSQLLLDTHALLWWLSDDATLVESARVEIATPRNDIFVSAATGWEISAKRATGRLAAPDNLAALIREEGFIDLPLTFHHAEQAGCLPMHHRDPIDRMLIAQAQAEGLIIVTRDANIPLYGVRTIAA